ncbi:MAG: hypothetical protein QM783_11780 [Phycisphaerales bacterium]
MAAQCVEGWQYGPTEQQPPGGAPLLWDADGPGPQPPSVVWIGSFSVTGKPVAYNQPAATYTPDGSILVLGNEQFVAGASGGSTSPEPTSRATIHNNELYICGSIQTIGGRPINNVARWDGTRWQPVGNGLYFINGASTTANNIFSFGGSLYLFTKTNSGSIYHFARWDGSTWTIDPFPAANGFISQTVQGPDGLYFLGDFTSIGGVAATRIARFDGTTFYPVGTLTPGFAGPPTITFDNGVLYATSRSGMTNGRYGLFKLDGGNWAAIPGSPTRLNGLTAFNGSIYGEENPGSSILGHQWWRWDGTAWSVATTFDPTGTVAPFGDPTSTLVLDGVMYFGTDTVPGWDSPRAGRWDGVTWRAMGGGVESVTIGSRFNAIQQWRGELYIGGGRQFITSTGEVVPTLAKWTTTGWQKADVPLPPQDFVDSMAVWKGQLLLNHAPSDQSQLPAYAPATRGLDRWDGEHLRPMTSGVFSRYPTASFGPFLIHNGRVYAKNPSLSYWDESCWINVTREELFSCMIEYRGAIVIGGNFTDLDLGRVQANHVAMYDGATWRPLGSGVNNNVNSFTTYQGQLIAFGRFSQAGGQSANGIARWNGSRWEGIPTTGIAPLSTGTFQFTAGMEYNGELYVTCPGTFNGSTPVAMVLRWNGVQWNLLGGDAPAITPSVFAVHNGQLFMSGLQNGGAGYPSGWARWQRDGAPSISQPPADAIAATGGNMSMAVASTGGSQFQWQREVGGVFVNLADGPRPSGALSGATTNTLAITGLGAQDAGRYRLVISSSCGSVASFPARLTISP